MRSSDAERIWQCTASNGWKEGAPHERALALTGGRTLAYATSGNASSTTAILYLDSAFTIGEASRVPQPSRQRTSATCAPHYLAGETPPHLLCQRHTSTDLLAICQPLSLITSTPRTGKTSNSTSPGDPTGR
ncbi:hypothetical protein JVU11DRAFT_9079 [Chiua virens]|nr:hypothetical protein JVU11DRAFT_9079 [Chiua virens]